MRLPAVLALATDYPKLTLPLVFVLGHSCSLVLVLEIDYECEHEYRCAEHKTNFTII